uniref:Un-named hu7910 n=1 Tax=Mastacembelus armatus TaxID=205130 RepID=A0A7N8XHW2_9TELE
MMSLEAKTQPVDNKNGKRTEGGGGDARGGPKYSMFTWFVVLGLLGVWSSVAIVYFDIVDYDSVIAKAKEFRMNFSEVLQGKLTVYDADGDGDFDVEDAKVLLGKERQEMEKLSKEKAAREDREQLKQERIDKEKMEKEHLVREQMREAQENAASEQQDKERIEKERADIERLQKEHSAKQTDRITKGKDSMDQEKLEKNQLEREKLEKERIAKGRAEKERLVREQIVKEREGLEKQRIANEKAEKERLERVRIANERERIAKQRIEQKNLEQEKLEREKLEKERIAKERAEKDRLERERIAKEKERIEQEKLEKERLEREKLEKERIAKERAEKDRLERERIAKEKERIEQEKLEKERLEREKLEKERIAKERAEKDRLERERIAKEKERIEQEKLEKERLEREKLEKERIAKERAEKDRLERERIAKERERIAKEKERIEQEKLEKERLEREKLEKERIAKEKAEKDRLERERIAKERERIARAKERIEQEKAEKERQEKEQIAKEERAEKLRLGKERLAKEKERMDKAAKDKEDRETMERERTASERARNAEKNERLGKEKQNQLLMYLFLHSFLLTFIQGKVEEALKAFELLVQQYPQSPRARYGKAQVEDDLAEKLRSNDMLQKAINTYREAAELPDVTSDLVRAALKRRAERQQFLGRMRGSLMTLEKLVQIFPEDISLKNDLGVAYLLLGDNKGAKKVYEEVLVADPVNGFAKVHYGFILKADNKIAESIPYLKEGLESGEPGTDDGRFYFHLGDALQRVGDKSAYYWYELGHKRGHFASVWQRSLYNVDGLKAQPWWTTKETGYTDLVKMLERNWKTIRDEALVVMDQNTGMFIPEEENLREKGEWGQYTLWQQGKKVGNACQAVPKTCSLIERYPEATGCKRGQIKFSVMQPGTHVWPHTGPTNCRLRMHLGLVIPKQGCKIRCTNETRRGQGQNYTGPCSFGFYFPSIIKTFI